MMSLGIPEPKSGDARMVSPSNAIHCTGFTSPCMETTTRCSRPKGRPSDEDDDIPGYKIAC